MRCSIACAGGMTVHSRGCWRPAAVRPVRQPTVVPRPLVVAGLGVQLQCASSPQSAILWQLVESRDVLICATGRELAARLSPERCERGPYCASGEQSSTLRCWWTVSSHADGTVGTTSPIQTGLAGTGPPFAYSRSLQC